jgi:hypothetical protein
MPCVFSGGGGEEVTQPRMSVNKRTPRSRDERIVEE